MSAHRLPSAAVALLVASVTVSCSHRSPAPTVPVERLGPAVETVSPAPRATRVPLDAEIWARFRAPLDPATVGPTTVFLKLDAARIPSSIVYDASECVVRVSPLVPLRLNRTYTIELTPSLATAEGVPLDSAYFWQFTTTSLRRLEHPRPLDGAPDRSPIEALGWDRTEPEAGVARYDVFVSTDSAAVRARTVTPTVTNVAYRVAPSRAVPRATLWWAVRATNLSTGESIESPLWHYGVVGAAAAIDSMMLPSASFTSVRSSLPTSPNCSAVTMIVGGNTLAAVSWNMAAGPPDARLWGARIILTATSYTARTDNSSLYGIQSPLEGCKATYAGPPYVDNARGYLAGGTFDVPTTTLRFVSEALSAHVQSALTFGAPSGYWFGSSFSFTIYSPATEGLRPALWLYYYRDPPGAPAATVHRVTP